MGLLSRIKSYLPPSSRSFHAMHNELAEQTAAISNDLYECRKEIADFRGVMFERTYQMEGSLRARMDGTSAQLGMYAWSLMQREGEPLADTKRRFFRGIPRATGGLRLMQLGCGQLLHEFDMICQEHDLSYWVTFGTLIGAVRHEGFVPWDDDTDLGMIRGDIERLQKIVQNDERYRLSVAYDPNVYCRQVRFMYRDSKIPCFLDLFVYDYVRDCDEETRALQLPTRRSLCVELEAGKEYSSWRGGHSCVDASRDEVAPVAAKFDEKIALLYQEDGPLTPNRYEAVGIAYGIDNMNDNGQFTWFMPIDFMFPTQRLTFEGHPCNAPRQTMRLLNDTYGDIYALPSDIVSHFEHVSRKDLRSMEFQDGMRNFFGDAVAGELPDEG